jgi:hypothetical protein
LGSSLWRRADSAHEKAPPGHRDMAAAQAFFHSAQAVTGITPDRVSIRSEP